MRQLLPVSVLVIAGLLFFAGHHLRNEFSIGFSVDSLEEMRIWVAGFGRLAPSVFVCVVAFRAFLFLPSSAVLIGGGLAFGTLAGTLWGSLGLALSGLMQYGAARVFGDAWIRARVRGQNDWTHRLRRAGPPLVLLVSAHPAGPLTGVNIGAGLAQLHFLPFLIAMTIGVPIRAVTYASLGNSILSWGLPTSLALALGLGTLAALPLASRRIRHWILERPSTPLDEVD